MTENSITIVIAHLSLLLSAEGGGGQDLEDDPGPLGPREEVVRVVAAQKSENKTKICLSFPPEKMCRQRYRKMLSLVKTHDKKKDVIVIIC